MCKARGKVRQNNPHIKCNGKKVKIEVHHIKELKDYPELALDDNNLITLCTRCHNEEHNRFAFQERKRFYTVERF